MLGGLIKSTIKPPSNHQHKERTESASAHLREQIYQFALHVNGLQGELLTSAVQQSSLHIIQWVFNTFNPIILRTDFCTHTCTNQKNNNEYVQILY